MTFENLRPMLISASELANKTNKEQEISILDNETSYSNAMSEAFDFLFLFSIDFRTRHDVHGFVLIIYPEINKS